jgi:hypothetical protein
VSNTPKQFSWRGLTVVAASAVLAVVTVFVGVQKKADPLATALLQAFTFILTIVGAYIFGKESVAAAAQDMVRQKVRSAFRRQRGLYAGLGRLIDEIDLQTTEQGDETVKLRLRILRAMITGGIWCRMRLRNLNARRDHPKGGPKYD